MSGGSSGRVGPGRRRRHRSRPAPRPVRTCCPCWPDRASRPGAGHGVAGVADVAAAPRPAAPLPAGVPEGGPHLRCAAAGDRHPAPRRPLGPVRRSVDPLRIVFEQRLRLHELAHRSVVKPAGLLAEIVAEVLHEERLHLPLGGELTRSGSSCRFCRISTITIRTRGKPCSDRARRPAADRGCARPCRGGSGPGCARTSPRSRHRSRRGGSRARWRRRRRPPLVEQGQVRVRW